MYCLFCSLQADPAHTLPAYIHSECARAAASHMGYGPLFLAGRAQAPLKQALLLYIGACYDLHVTDQKSLRKAFVLPISDP